MGDEVRCSFLTLCSCKFFLKFLSSFVFSPKEQHGVLPELEQPDETNGVIFVNEKKKRWFEDTKSDIL